MTEKKPELKVSYQAVDGQDGMTLKLITRALTKM